jgi:hypothetical protein
MMKEQLPTLCKAVEFCREHPRRIIVCLSVFLCLMTGLAVAGVLFHGWMSRDSFDPGFPAGKMISLKIDGAGDRTGPAAAAQPGGRRRPSQRFYISGIKHYDQGEVNQAYKDWEHCRQTDPGNADCAAGLAKLKALWGLPSKAEARRGSVR